MPINAVIPEAPPTIATLLGWNPQPVPILPLIGVTLAVLYCWGIFRLRARGTKWQGRRTASFLFGCGLLIVVTGLGIEGYGHKLFSVWMFQHLTLSMAIPPLLVLGSPGRLLLRTAAHHGAGRILLIVALSGLRSRAARIMLNPGVTIPLFLFSYYGLYLSSLLDIVGSSWIGHIAIELFFLASGLLFIVPILSTGPLPVRQSNIGRFFDLFLEMPLHVFFGVIVMMSTSPMVSLFAYPPSQWGIDPMTDQQLAGGLAWSYGEPIALLIVIVFAVRWNRDEARTSAVKERRIDDAELTAYNQYLKSLDPQR
ncbi:cytochrome c oxidase assembly protein [Antrihabitans sp. NCIMB 15449]|uniref:Cytochrome c oxidase assembly protein n=1 Tax=Antrihabitans spumae TaxID=3373370 RepID=A0ABW7JQ47_9NOCA